MHESLGAGEDEKRRGGEGGARLLATPQHLASTQQVVRSDQREEALQLRVPAHHRVRHEVEQLRRPQQEQLVAPALARLPRQRLHVQRQSTRENSCQSAREEEGGRGLLRRTQGQTPVRGEEEKAGEFGEETQRGELVEDGLMLPRDQRAVQRQQHAQQLYASAHGFTRTVGDELREAGAVRVVQEVREEALLAREQRVDPALHLRLSPSLHAHVRRLPHARRLLAHAEEETLHRFGARLPQRRGLLGQRQLRLTPQHCVHLEQLLHEHVRQEREVVEARHLV